MAPEDSRSPNADTTGRLADLPECRSSQTHQSVILVADDDLQVRKLVTRLMEQDGHFVLSAADGQEALELSRQYAGSIALLITGVRMPRLNGTDLCAHLLKERPEIKVIFSINADLSELFAPSADLPFLTKPINAQTLRTKVREIMSSPVSLPLDKLPSGSRSELQTGLHNPAIHNPGTADSKPNS